MPEVSVIMPAFNSEDTILESVNSVRNQSFEDWELIIVDDCSLDSTLSIIEAIIRSESRIRLKRSRINKGPAAARNIGMKASSGKYIAFLDADDIWEVNNLEKRINFHYDNPILLISHSNYSIFDSLGLRNRSKLDVFYKKKGNLIPTLYYKNTIATLTVFLNRKIVEKVGFFNEDLFGVEDHEYWLRIAEKGYLFGYINKKLTKYRINENGISRLSGRYKKNFKRLTAIRLKKAGDKYQKKILANQYRFLGVSFINNSNILLGKLYLLKSLSYSRFHWLSIYIIFFLIKIIIKSNVRNIRNN